MVNESILGGLRVAISHKSSLKEAMQSFYNAGYDKGEIEEAAKIIFEEQQNMPQQTETKQNSKSTPKIGQPPKEKSPKKIGLIIALVALILILVVGLATLFIFKDKIF